MLYGSSTYGSSPYAGTVKFTIYYTLVNTFSGKAFLEGLPATTLAGTVDLRYIFTTVNFAGINLNNIYEITEKAIHDSAPTRNLAIYKVARRDGEKLVSAYFARKEIDISGFIQKSTQWDLEEEIDRLKSLVQGKQGALDIEYGMAGVYRRYYATFSKLVIQREPDNIDWAPFQLKLIVPSGMGEDTELTEYDFGINNIIPYLDIEFNNPGSTDARPVLTLTMKSIVNLTEISIENLADGTVLNISESFNNDDVLEIDYDSWTIKLNGALIDWSSGAFGSVYTGNNTLRIQGTGTSGYIQPQISFYAKYL